MNKTIKASLIGASATILAAIIGLNTGKSMEQKHIQNEINAAMGDMVNIIGDGNNVTINDIKDLITDYQNLKSNNDSLIAQNAKYFDDLTNANKQLEELQSNVENIPAFVFNDFGLCINGGDSPINKNSSMVTIDGNEYFSKEIIDSLLSDNENMTIKDDTIFIGKVIADKADLSKQKIVDCNSGCEFFKTAKDSYGNTYSNIVNLYNGARIIYNLERKYTIMDLQIAISSNSQLNEYCILTIKADDKTVYTSEQLSKTTEPFLIDNIPINNCSLLTIEYNGDWGNQCIVSNGIVYN